MTTPSPQAGDSPLNRVTPLVITDGAGRLCGLLLAETTLSPGALLERLYERAEAWLTTRAGASLRAQALQAATSPEDLRVDLVSALAEMLPSTDLGHDVAAARLLLDPDDYGEIDLREDEGVPVLFSADADGEG